MNPLEPIEVAIGWLLSVFYSVVPNLGLAIILLTCIVMAALLPLTAKQTRSMIAMQRIQPEIKKIQAQYKDDRQKQNEALMQFYQENNVNPLSGCLPLIIQAPVLFALFQVLRDVQKHIPTTGAFNDLFRDLCGSATTAGACDNPKDMYFLGLNLMVTPANSGSVTSNLLERLPYFLAVAAVVASGWYQMWQTQLRQKRLGNQNNPMNKQMQMISRVMPIAFGWFSWIASSGLVLYFVTSSLWRIGQQHLVLNRYYDEHAAEMGITKKKAAGKKEAGKVPGKDSDGEPKAGGGPGPGATSASSADAKKELPPNKPAPPGAGNRSTSGAAGNGARPYSQPSPHTSRKKRKRRR
jgi:YidC/Oxa1 family membrane protein insertase